MPTELGSKLFEALKNSMLWTFFVALFGGAVGAAVTVWSTRSLAKKERLCERLHFQLSLLYGPIYYKVLQNKTLFELNKKFLGACNKELKGKNWSQDPTTQKAVGEVEDTTIGLANAYIHEVVGNSERIRAILDKHFGLCDPKDINVFNLFYEHYIRYKIEFEESGKLKTPMGIYKHIGNISFIRPEFMQQIEERCRAKQDEYLQLTS